MQQTSNSLRQLFYNHTGNLVFKWDHYFEIYERYFAKYINQKVNILEIGVFQGGSLKLWKKYFGDQVNLYAIDINPNCKSFEEENVKIFIGSQEDTVFLKKVADELPELDIIIDDGGHSMTQQITSFESLFHKVKQGGIYLVEDTHTSYWYKYQGGLRKPNTFIEYSKNIIDSLHSHYIEEGKFRNDEITQNINSISFYDSIVVFEKFKRSKPFAKSVGESTVENYKEIMLEPTFLMKLKDLLLVRTGIIKVEKRNYFGD